MQSAQTLTDPTSYGVQISNCLQSPFRVGRRAQRIHHSPVVCLASRGLALFLLEAHPSILSGSSDTGCGASGEAADEKASMRALICVAVPALAFASLTPQHLVYMSQLAVLNHS